MEIERGVIAGCTLLAITAVIFAHAAPPAVRTPARVVQSGIEVARHVADRGRAQNGPSLGEGSAPTRQPASALAELITRSGRRCDAVVMVTPIRSGDGLFRVACRAGLAAVSYSVDTRRAVVQALT